MPTAVLLVEDSMIIALDTEHCLRDLGVKEVGIAVCVADALAALAKDAPDMAVLDFNLGVDSSEPVAAELVRMGVPFWLATGNGEIGARLEELGARGLLTKPYGTQHLAQMLAEFSALG